MRMLLEALEKVARQENTAQRAEAAALLPEQADTGMRKRMLFLALGGALALATGYLTWSYLAGSLPFFEPARVVLPTESMPPSSAQPSGVESEQPDPVPPLAQDETVTAPEGAPSPVGEAPVTAGPNEAVAKKGLERAQSRQPQAAKPGRAQRMEPGLSLKMSEFFKAQAAAERGDHRAAERHYANAIRIEPYNRAAILGRARSPAQLGELAEAERLYANLLALDARDADALTGLALLRGSSDPDGWLARIEAAIEFRPDHPGLRFALGSLLADRNEWRAAARAFGQAARLAPTAEYYYNQAICLDRAGMKAEAVQAYRQALALYSRSEGAFDRQAVEARIAALERN